VKNLLCSFALVLAVAAAIAGACIAGYQWGLREAEQPLAEALASTYVYGRAVDAQGGAVASVRVKLGTQSSTTNQSGQWGVTLPWPVAGQAYYLYVFPEVVRLFPPAGVSAVLQSGNVIRLTVPKTVPAQLGPFMLEMRMTSTPTMPATAIIPTQTKTVTPPMPPTNTATPRATAFVTVTPRPSPTGTGHIKPGYWQAPSWVINGMVQDLIIELDVDLTDSLDLAAAYYNLGIRDTPIYQKEYCSGRECYSVRFALYAGEMILAESTDNVGLVSFSYFPFNGDANWHEKTAIPEGR
jgi:hypothetical protein